VHDFLLETWINSEPYIS